MKNYTTQTASLKATTIDTRILDTKILKINGETFDPSQIEGDYNSVVWKMTIGDAITANSNTYNVIALD
jgi:hypothetical protein